MVTYKRRFGDRNDGRLIRTLDPFYKIIPYIMRTRIDSQTYFDDKIEIDTIEAYIRAKRDSGIKNIGFIHVLMAVLVRTLSQKPALNRFIAGQRIYARNEILISLAVKKKLQPDSPETTIKLKFQREDTIFDVVKKINAAIAENKKIDSSNDTDKVAKLIMYCPGFIVKFLMFIISFLDYHRILPKALIQVSPFHTSVFVTDLGSIGIQPVFHHLYEFGTTSIFVAFGAKIKEKVIDKENNIVEKKYINIKAVTDERIVDGHYYASSFKFMRNLMQHPESLELPPEKVYEDVM